MFWRIHSARGSRSGIFFFVFVFVCVCLCVFRKSIADEIRDIEREEGLAAKQSSISTTVSGVPTNARMQRAKALRAKLASRQQKFLGTTGDDQVSSY